MFTKETFDMFDQIIRERLVEQQKKLKISDHDIGQKAFPWMKSPRMKMQALKGIVETKKSQNIRLIDFIVLCEILQLSWIEEVFLALKKLKKMEEI